MCVCVYVYLFQIHIYIIFFCILTVFKRRKNKVKIPTIRRLTLLIRRPGEGCFLSHSGRHICFASYTRLYVGILYVMYTITYDIIYIFYHIILCVMIILLGRVRRHGSFDITIILYYY